MKCLKINRSKNICFNICSHLVVISVTMFGHCLSKSDIIVTSFYGKDIFKFVAKAVYAGTHFSLFSSIKLKKEVNGFGC